MPLDPTRPFPIRPRLLDRESYIGIKGHFITINAFNKNKVFIASNIVQTLVGDLYKISKKENFEVIAYCFMPDHLHLVLCGMTETSDLQKFIKQYKQITGFWLKKKVRRKIWAYSYFDHVLREQEDMRSVGIYTLLNPVRAGIVEKAKDYPFSGSFTLSSEDIEMVDSFF